ncbi:MAG: D-glycerate dehydrogenase [Chloroflexi bacterium]|nr:D-glycerate dehydrogenase [Chloroflexota bacterium]
MLSECANQDQPCCAGRAIVIRCRSHEGAGRVNPPERPRVFVALRLQSDAKARIEAVCDVDYFEGQGLPSKSELIAGVAKADGLLGSAQLPVDSDVLAAASKLRVVSNFGVGFDNVDLDAATKGGVLVCNTPGVLTDAVADLTLGLILALARRLPEAERFARDGDWQRGARMALGTDVRGKTLGIIGLGRIGVAVAERAHAFGMSITFHDIFRQPPIETPPCSYRELDDLLAVADFVSLHVNLRPETRGLIGAKELTLMKPTAYLINTSRGQTVDQAALVAGLRSGELAGAALDVLEEEPLPPDDPLAALPNVILLPHIGSATVETRQAMRDLAIDNLLAALRGERPEAVVNAEVLS